MEATTSTEALTLEEPQVLTITETEIGTQPAPGDAPKEEELEFQVDVQNFTNSTNKEIDYDKLIKHFGTRKIEQDLLERFEAVTGRKPHLFIRRGIFFSHRDLDKFLKAYEEGKQVFLYTGRGPASDAMHVGHLLPFIFTQWLQETFKCPLVIQLTDDEKFFFNKDKKDIQHYADLGIENAKDIIACGFDKERTFIFRDTDYIGTMYPNVVRFQKMLTYSQCKGIFGLSPEDNCGRVAFPAIQAVPCFSNTFPHIFGKTKDAYCLIPQGIDQDPYFRMTRDIAERLKYRKPCCIHGKMFPALQGFQFKMSGSDASSAVFLTDTFKVVQKKVNKFAFSGGGQTSEMQREHGANLEVDIAYNWLKFFMEDDEKYAEIGEKYSKGEMMTGEVKDILIDILGAVIKKHQEARKGVTNEIVMEWMAVRPIKTTRD